MSTLSATSPAARRTPNHVRDSVSGEASSRPAGDPDGLDAAIAAAPSLAALDAAAAAIWARWGEGALDDARAGALAALVAARRAAIRGPQGAGARAGASASPSPAPTPEGRPPLPRWRFPAPRAPRRPDRDASRERRRRLAASGPMPPALAARFTTGELAALKIVADEIAARGDCRLPLGAVAARAGVSETTARNALRAAARAGLLAIEARPRRGLPNLTNVVRMIDRQWRDWIARRRDRGEGAKNPGARIQSLVLPAAGRAEKGTSDRRQGPPRALPPQDAPPRSARNRASDAFSECRRA